MVLGYYRHLRSLLRARPDLRKCLTRCRDCRIRFLTDPRNVHRTNIRCPFGCRQVYKKESSTLRSTKYYKTWEGKIKKKIQNNKRSARAESEASLIQETRNSSGTAVHVPDETMLKQLEVATGLIERRPVLREEILLLLKDAVRQRRIQKRILRCYYANCSRGSPQ